jgi:hypothetical protein
MSKNIVIDLFGLPDDLNAPLPKPLAKSRPKKVHKDKVVAPSPTSTNTLVGQGFLPGLSRRGRPRLSKPISAVERTAEHRRKRIANGAKRVEIILDRDVSHALDRLAEHHKEPKSDVIAALIRKAAARIKQ